MHKTVGQAGGVGWSKPLRDHDRLMGIWSVDITTNRITLDATMAGLFGLSKEEAAIGVDADRVLERVHPADRERALSVMVKAIELGEPYVLHYRLRVRPGHYVDVCAVGNRFSDEAGQPTHLAGVLVDQAETGSAENEVVVLLIRALEAAKATNDTMLPRLIEAVLLHAGQSLACTLKVGKLN